MGWQSVVITKPCKLSIKNNNLLLLSKVGVETKLAIDEISAIIIEEREVVITAPFLSMCAEKDIALFVCDSKHIPSGILTPFHTHSRFSKNAYLQINTSKPLKNRIWQKIIQQKILNQREVLLKTDSGNASVLQNLSNEVVSGDKKNCEGVAAGVYWKSLFNDFFRGMPEVRSRALDYGYSIIRGAIARSLSAGGFLPTFGVFHKSELNPFNLADDFIEPFRAFVDLKVFETYGREISKPMKYNLEQEVRVVLVDLLNEEVNFDGENTTILTAIEESIYSYRRCLSTKNIDELKIVKFRDE